ERTSLLPRSCDIPKELGRSFRGCEWPVPSPHTKILWRHHFITANELTRRLATNWPMPLWSGRWIRANATRFQVQQLTELLIASLAMTPRPLAAERPLSPRSHPKLRRPGG